MSSKPEVLRLAKRIATLERKLYSYEPKPYGGSNPYYYCASCERSMIEASYAGHYGHCQFSQLQGQVKKARAEYEISLKAFLDARAFESKSFTNYLWFKEGIYVVGLDNLVREVKKFKENLRKVTSDRLGA